jgi:hypothetical protein
MDQKFDGVAFDLFSPAVDAIFQLAAREDGSRPNQQGLQQRELAVGQLHRGATVNAGFFVAGSSDTTPLVSTGVAVPPLRRRTARIRANSSAI